MIRKRIENIVERESHSSEVLKNMSHAFISPCSFP